MGRGWFPANRSPESSGGFSVSQMLLGSRAPPSLPSPGTVLAQLGHLRSPLPVCPAPLGAGAPSRAQATPLAVREKASGHLGLPSPAHARSPHPSAPVATAVSQIHRSVHPVPSPESNPSGTSPPRLLWQLKCILRGVSSAPEQGQGPLE